MRLRTIVILTFGLILLTSCSQDEESSTTLADDPAATATTLASGGSGSDDATTSTTEAVETTTTTEAPMLPSYDIAHRSPGDNGDTLVVVLSDTSDGVTDHDLEQVILDIVDTFGPVAEAHIIDDASVLELVLMDPAELDEGQQELLASHYLLKLVDGTSVSFQGPFEDVPGYEIGS